MLSILFVGFYVQRIAFVSVGACRRPVAPRSFLVYLVGLVLLVRQLG